MDERLKKAEFFIEATHYEVVCLWDQYAEEGTLVPRIGLQRYARHKWEQDRRGECQNVGELKGMPVVIVFEFATIDGILVAFWEPTSQVVDHRMIEKWMLDNFPETPQWNASNFCGLISRIDRKSMVPE